MTQTWDFEAIGTKWSITLDIRGEDGSLPNIQKVVAECIETFDKNYSRFREGSLLRMWSTPGVYNLPADGFTLFSFYKELYDTTDAQVTPLIGQTMEEAGYDANYSLTPKPLSKVPAWNDALVISPEKISILQPIRLDVGAAGKGYLVDQIIDIFKAYEEIEGGVVNAGGDMRRWTRSGSNKKLVIGLENPSNPQEVIGTTLLSNAALCASSGMRRQWGTFHHTISPVTLTSPDTVVATWVMASSAMLADGLATALFFTPPEKLTDFTFEYALLDNNNQLTYSKNFIHEVFTV